MKQYPVYLFDFDGTLVDSQDSLTAIFVLAYRSIGIEISSSDIPTLMRIPLLEGYLAHHGDKDKWETFLSSITSGLQDLNISALTKTFSEVNDVLFKLHHRHATLGIVTSNDEKHVNDVLKILNIDPSLFQVIIGSNQCKEIKPSPAPILMSLSKLNISANENDIVYIGDSINDYQSGKNAGISAYLLDRHQEYGSLDIPKIKTLKELL